MQLLGNVVAMCLKDSSLFYNLNLSRLHRMDGRLVVELTVMSLQNVKNGRQYSIKHIVLVQKRHI